MGDAASNIGRAGHNQRHHAVLRRLVIIMQAGGVGHASREGAPGPQDLSYTMYLTHRPSFSTYSRAF